MPSRREEDEPFDELTRVAAIGVDAIEAELGTAVKAIVMVMREREDGDQEGGIAMFGYEHDMDAVVDAFVHLRQILRANGKDLGVMTMPGQG